MDGGLLIRDATADDTDAISKVTLAAFATLEISGHTEHHIVVEHHIVEALRAAGALTVSLVAERNSEVVGHIAFSPITMSDGSAGWFGLGPVSVLPKYQRRGIGTALVEHGLARLRRLGAQGCCLVGHPEYYGRFGFSNPSGLAHKGVPPEAFFALAFAGEVPRGTVAFHEAFAAGAPREPGNA